MSEKRECERGERQERGGNERKCKIKSNREHGEELNIVSESMKRNGHLYGPKR